MTRIRHGRGRTPAWTALAALAILLVAGWFRVVGFDWDRRRLLHPDERFLVMTTAALPWPGIVTAILAAEHSPLNPRQPGRWFAYGSLPVTLARAATAGVDAARLTDVVRVGRATSVIADMLTLCVLGWWTRRLWGTSAALVASALYACAVLPIQHAHFFVVEPQLTLWSTVAVALLACWHRRPGLGLAMGVGAATALAIACKVSGAMLLAPAALAWLSRAARLDGPAVSWTTRRRLAAHAGVCALAGLVTLRVAAPDMFAGGWLPWPSRSWLEAMRTMQQLTSGLDDAPPSWQWVARPPWFVWWNTVRFGLGVPLGLLATVATVAGAWRVLGRWRSSLLVPVVWTLTIAVIVSLQYVSAMRYLLPIYPTLCLLAAWALTRLPAIIRSDRRRRMRMVTAVATVTVLGATVVWAVAFTSIYRELHPRLAASRWIFDNVPAGTVLTAEAWDDALPYSASRQTQASRYTVVTLPVTDEDTARKVEALLDGLSRATYVVVSSDRNAGSLTRLPRRFPVMTRYYDALEDGRLGFAQVAAFESRPRLGSWHISDAHAEEAFTVYDHPAVRLYRKQAGWTAERARAVLLDGLDSASIVRTTGRQLSAAPQLLELTAARRAQLAQEGTWRTGAGAEGRFASSPPSGLLAVARWGGVVLLLGLLAWPICAVLLPLTWGRGGLVAPAFGLLWVAWVVWLWGTVSPWPLSIGVLQGAIAGLAAAGGAVAWRARADLGPWVRTHWPLLLGQGACVAALACVGIGVRALNPDLWHPTLGGEKPMDIALLSALVRADRFPAYDPWFAGGVLNYYYAGFLPAALLCRVTGVEPALGYTLAVGTWWALTAAGLASVAGTLVARLASHGAAVWAAVAAATLGVVAGNLRQLELLWRLGSGAVDDYLWFWHASRAIPVPPGEVPPITEFPAFTFLFADLHAHMLAMPWMLGAVLVSLQLALHARRDGGTSPDALRTLAPVLCMGGLLVGMLMATNAWDAPTALALVGAGVALAVLPGVPHGQRVVALRRLVVLLGSLALVALAAAWPFLAHFTPPAGGVAPWRGARTPIPTALLIHGPFLLVLAAAGIVLWRTRHNRHDVATARWLVIASGLALALVAAVEVVVVRGDVGRMNTVFKVYLQVWLIWSACVPAAWLIVRRALPAGTWPRHVFHVGSAALLAAMLVYPLTAVAPRVASRMAPGAPRGLDGAAFLTHAALETDGGRLPLDEDHAMTRWLLDHVPGTPTIAEAQTDQYQWGARISAHTGLPTVLGWTWHARQQRMALPSSVVARRRADVRTFFDSPSADDAWRVARRYDIRYVIVGQLERQRYAPEGLAKFDADARWRRVFTVGASRIYTRDE